MCKLQFELKDFKARNEFQIAMLEVENDLFAKSQYIIRDEFIEIDVNDEYYNEDNLLSNKKLNYYEKLVVLYNCLFLSRLDKNYFFSLKPSNIIVLPNLNVKIVVRDINDGGNESFVNRYKSLFGTVINPKYSYEDFLLGGMDLLTKNNTTKKILEDQEESSLMSSIEKMIDAEKQRIENDFVLVNKSTFNKNKVKNIILTILTVLAIAFGIFSINSYKTEKKVANIQSNYIKKDYSATVEASKSLSVNKMNNEVLFSIAQSYIEIEVTDKETKTRMEKLVSINSDTEILKYFVYLAQNNFSKAQDCAYNINDKDFMVFAYLKEINYISTDSKLSASEKDEKISQIESKVKELGYELKDDK